MLTVRYHRRPASDAASAAAASAATESDWVLGRVCYSTLRPADDAAWVPLPSLTSPLFVKGAVIEEWIASPPLRSGVAGELRYRCNAELLFGWISVDEHQLADRTQGSDSPLQQATAAAYQQIFATLDQLGYPLLLRVWNFVPAINQPEQGEERYRRFNASRQLSFERAGRVVTGNVPAATAIGSTAGALIIYFIAGHNAATPIENPRQIAAYHYPREHGRKSPTFSRAGLYRSGEQTVLMISGTASIVGHQTLHEGDVVAQTHELLANIAAVLAEANKAMRDGTKTIDANAIDPNTTATWRPFQLDELLYKAYIRHAEDLAPVQAVLETVIGANANVVYLLADICRSNLLVEVEACSAR